MHCGHTTFNTKNNNLFFFLGQVNNVIWASAFIKCALYLLEWASGDVHVAPCPYPPYNKVCLSCWFIEYFFHSYRSGKCIWDIWVRWWKFCRVEKCSKLMCTIHEIMNFVQHVIMVYKNSHIINNIEPLSLPILKSIIILFFCFCFLVGFELHCCFGVWGQNGDRGWIDIIKVIR